MNAGPLRLLLVDDEAPARTRLRDLLGDIAANLATQIIGEAADGKAALDFAANKAVDVVLIDIRMPGMDGIELARHLNRLPTPPAIIFVTAFDQYAIKAFELAAVDYLLKPVRAARLLAALQKARRHDAGLERLFSATQEKRRNLPCLERGRILLVPVDEILYLKAEQKYVTARTQQREFILEESLTHLETEFDSLFMRVHRSFLVARAAVLGVEKAPADSDTEGHWQVILRHLDERPPVSRRLWSQVKSSLNLPAAD